MPLTLTTSDYSTVTNTSQKFTAMVAGNQYVLRSSVNCYFKVGPSASVTASAADGSHFLAAGMPAYVAKKGADDTVAIIRDSSDGAATLSLMEPGSIQ